MNITPDGKRREVSVEMMNLLIVVGFVGLGSGLGLVSACLINRHAEVESKQAQVEQNREARMFIERLLRPERTDAQKQEALRRLSGIENSLQNINRKMAVDQKATAEEALQSDLIGVIADAKEELTRVREFLNSL